MSHTSGFPAYLPEPKRDAYQTLAEAVSEIAPLSPVADPGALFQYGGLAMQVAGRMAERATGMDWETLFQRTIASPLRMKNTHFTPVDPAPGHNPMLGGGARTTLHDYGNFLAMISQGGAFEGRRILSERAVREMQADQVRGATLRPGEYVEKARGGKHNGVYGLGEWREILDPQGQAVLLSSPSWAGAYPWIDKSRHLYGFFLAHVDGPAASRDHFDSFFSSPVLPMLIGQAVDQGVGDSCPGAGESENG